MDDGDEGLHPFVAVAFVEPVGEVRFGKRHWPLHVTLLRFDLAPEAAREAATGALSAFQPFRIRIGRDADFGYRGRVRVSLVEHDAAHSDPLKAPDPLQELHERVRDAVVALGGRIHSLQHTGRGFRPHVTVQGERRVHAGETVVLHSVALVDMAPGGDTEWRLPVAQWR